MAKEIPKENQTFLTLVILYIGNKLNRHGNNPTGMEYLASKLSVHYDIHSISHLKNKFLRLAHIVVVLVLKRNTVKLVLIDTYSTLNFYFALTSAILSHYFAIKYIVILRGGNLPMRLKKNPKLCKLLLKSSYKIVSPSLYLQKEFSEFGYDVLFIPNAMDISRYPYRTPEIDHPKLLYVRSFHKTYNPTMAVKVVRRLLAKYQEARLTMVGPDKDGSLEDVKKLAEEYAITDRVKFTGYISKDEIISISKHHNIFINTTNFDNMPVSVMEAMALGIPVVSTNVGGIPYLIKDKLSGLLVDKENVSAMVDAIEYLICNPDIYKEISKNARQVIAAYDWEKMFPTWKSLLDEALQ